MDKKRRDFLKIAGVSTLAGLGGATVAGRLVSGSSPVQARAAHVVDSAAQEAGHGAPKAEAGGHGATGEVAKSGNRWGMVIDMRKFREHPGLAEKVVHTCHSIHNVPNFPDKKDEIKWIWLMEYENVFPEHSHYFKNKELLDHEVLVMCNHCDNPPCVKACPTRATFKNKDGIVAMDYHRCIGCRFCMAACPYGARSFNWRNPRDYIENYNREFPSRMRGVVEKCNLCAERVALGKQPACVEACGDTKAMIFGNLNDPDSEIRQVLKANYTIQRKPSLGTHPSVFYIV
ncbi:4Fe-4S ferredoxin [Desulfolithobacter dissulfuricans]|uniref:4Fe-4S ferredoxin n=1 Tax=Desulfolithobacter dissulfuricans TaxID=2795293 RepID=A0A915U2V2_9BACT|nr:4Fe-4S dicluster domain-containing protein [Desulfolithobacter dissulfuricans]BCO10319.1 4Fe-4S ferredoxin [Desulfolithobacter dissulfuricans]